MRIEPRAIAFDLDDTLWSCDEVIGRAERAVYAWLSEHYSAITDEFGLEDMRAIRHRAMEQQPELAADLSELRLRTLRWHARRADCDERLAERALGVFLDERNRVELFDDVLPALERLRARAPLVALTNGNADLARIGIDHLFSVQLSAADVGAPKPDPAMFHAACEALGLRPGDLVHVGDDPHRDVHAARRFGARSVWINRVDADWPEGVPRAHHEIDTLEPLSDLIFGESERRA